MTVNLKIWTTHYNIYKKTVSAIEVETVFLFAKLLLKIIILLIPK